MKAVIERWLVLFLILVLIFISGVLICFGNEKTESKKNLPQDELGIVTFSEKKYRYNSDITSILFLGVDNGSKMLKQDIPGLAGQADTILLFSFNKKTKESYLLQIPRDTMTEVALYDGNGNQYDSKEMQVALQYAYSIGGKSSCWATKKTVSELLNNLPINGYLAIDIAALPILIDALGGVTVKFEEDYTEVDPLFQNNKVITLSGDQAEKFVRYRNIEQPFSNQERMVRQNIFIKSLISLVREKAGNELKNQDAFTSIAEEYMVTDLREDQIDDAGQYLDENMKIQILPGEWKTGKEYDEFYLNREKVGNLLLDMFYIEEIN